MAFSSPEDLGAYVRAAIKQAEPNKTHLLQQAMEFIAGQIQAVAASPNADLEGMLTFLAKGWARGDIDLAGSPDSTPTSPQATPAVIASGARGSRLRFKANYATKQRLQYKDIKQR